MFKGKLGAAMKQLVDLIPQRLTDLSGHIDELLIGERANLAEATTIAHRLRGSAGTLGLHRVGEVGCLVEDALNDILRSGLPLSESSGASLKLLIGEATAEVLASQAERTESIDGEPAELQAAQAGTGKAADSAAVMPHYASGLHASLLLVDDDDIFSEFVRRIGRQRLIDVTCAGSAEEAVELATLHRFDGILIDLHLWKGMDVYELVAKLRQSDVPLSFISANASTEDRIAAAEAGAVLFLDKPIEPEDLEAAVQHMRAISHRLRPKVLLIEDDELFVALTEDMLHRNGIECLSTGDGLNILSKLASVQPDLLVLDADLPKLNGYELCRLVRSSPVWQHIPIIFITAKIDPDSRVKAFRAGADDYITKPLVEEELIVKVTGRIERAALLRDRTTRDTVTGVLIRATFLEKLRHLCTRAHESNSKLSIAMLDIDTFKKVNDVGGHLIGDSVLAGLGRLLCNSFGVDDLRGRWGGDEFVLALSEDKVTAGLMLEKLLAAFQKIEFLGEHGEPFYLSFSAGVAQFPDEGVSAYDLVKVADGRLYKAKLGGRARVEA